MTRLFGPLLVLGVVLLGAVAAARAPSANAAAAALRDLGTLLTVVTGLISALWWHRSSDPASAQANQQDAAVLNGGAATATALALLGGVYTGLPWLSAESTIVASAFLLLLGMSGREIWLAGTVSFRSSPAPRAVLASVVLVLAGLLFVYRHIWQ